MGIGRKQGTSNDGRSPAVRIQTHCARILLESARFPPFGFNTLAISSNSNEDMSFLQTDALCPDSARERSARTLRVQYSGDKLEFE